MGRYVEGGDKTAQKSTLHSVDFSAQLKDRCSVAAMFPSSPRACGPSVGDLLGPLPGVLVMGCRCSLGGGWWGALEGSHHRVVRPEVVDCGLLDLPGGFLGQADEVTLLLAIGLDVPGAQLQQAGGGRQM
jgi:hypothetical protein